MDKKKFVFQWHITHKCNLRCKHCYQDDYCSDLGFDELRDIFYKIMDFCNVKDYRCHINVTGGEPFVSPNLFPLLDLCEENNVTFGILTNGTFLDEGLIQKLSKYKGLSFVQVSIDGVKQTHDDIRGVGNFDKTIEFCHLLKKYHIESMVSFTAHKQNYKEVGDVIKIIERNKIDRFFADRFIPIDCSKEINEAMVLDNREFEEFVKIIVREKNKAKRNPFYKTNIQTNRAMQFCYDDENIVYFCSAGLTLLTILANGDVVPCRRLPIVFGNLLKDNLVFLYDNSEVIKDLKAFKIPNECGQCDKACICKGGAKCLNYALFGDYNKKDFNCTKI